MSQDDNLTEKMQAAVFYGVKEGIRVLDVPAPKIERPDDVLIEVKACGICGTDLNVINGRHHAPTPIILGHEYAGTVMKVGNLVQTIKPGDHVVVDPNIKCGKCHFCRSGKQNLCENMRTLGLHINGGFANFNVAPERAIYKIPDDMNWRDAALVEPVSCVIHAVNRAQIRLGEKVAVLGAGPMGQLLIASAKKAGAETIIASEIAEKRRKLAKQFGADVIINPKEEDVHKKIRDLTEGRGADLVIEAAGNTETVRQALQIVAKGGKVLLFGVCPDEAQIPFRPYDIAWYERNIMGSFPQTFTFKQAIGIMYRGMIPSDILVTHEFEVTEIHKALAVAKGMEGLKILIRPV